MKILGVFFRPPLAFARLGGARSPMDNYLWREDPTLHGAARNVIEPALSLDVLPNGSVYPFTPSVIRFREGAQLRPVAPFFELWASVEYGAADPEVTAAAPPGADPPNRPAPGSKADVPVTGALLERMDAGLADVVYEVRVANRKAARRTGDETNAFEAGVRVGGDDFGCHSLLASTPPRPGSEPLVRPEHPIPLGSFRVIRPVGGQVGAVDLDVLRVRFTPPRGEVYGPPSAVVGRDDRTGREYEMVPAANRILNPAASWLRYDSDYTKYLNPEPSDTYDGAGEGANQSWGVVDDTSDGVVTTEVVIDGRRFTAAARICVGPPDYAPDRRPFLSLADDLTDRDVEPPSADELLGAEADTQQRLADLFQRVWETAGLVNLDAIRARALRDNTFFPGGPKIGELPYTDVRSMRPSDTPYADAKVQALIPEEPSGSAELVFSRLVELAHDQLAGKDELMNFLLNQAERVHQMIRPAYGAFEQLSPTVGPDQTPNPDFRDPRIFRDQMHDMRMPPYMRDEAATALGLTRHQYLTLMTYVDAVAAAVAPAEAAPVPPAAAEQGRRLAATLSRMPFRRRVQHRLQRIQSADQSARTDPADPAGSQR
ncbi:MAG: hypothetical protein ACRDT0_01045 [Pseudonocardiaceae bacterium]